MRVGIEAEGQYLYDVGDGARVGLDLSADPRDHADREGVVEAEGVADGESRLPDAQCFRLAEPDWRHVLPFGLGVDLQDGQMRLGKGKGKG